LTIDYARTPATVLSGHRWIVGVIAAIVLLSLGKTLGRLRIGLLIMVAALLPVLGFLPFDFQRYSTVADRFMYLPMLGVALAAAACPRPFVFLILILLAWQAEFQLGFWRDTRTLADRTLALDPLSTVGNKILAADLAHDQQWPRAAAAYRKALIHNPEDGDLHFNLANALRGQGDYESAIDEYLTSIRLLNPDLRLGAMNNLGIAYFQAGEPDMAQAEFLAVLQIDPHNADARKNLAQVVRGVPSQ
jgi:tetratricopeptide (TPR) repeat protein